METEGKSNFLPGPAPSSPASPSGESVSAVFAAALNNFLADIHHITEFERGVVEFFRELPGFALIFIWAFLHRVSDWRILRLGTAVSS